MVHYNTKYSPLTGEMISKVKSDARLNKEYPNLWLKTGAVRGEHKAIESVSSRYARMFVYPFVALQHLNMPANLLFTPLTDMAKGLGDILGPGGLKAAQDQLSQYGLFADDLSRAMSDSFKFRNGMIAKLSNNPELGQAINSALTYSWTQLCPATKYYMDGNYR